MTIPPALARQTRLLLRVSLSYYASNGMAAALGLFLISALVHLLLGATAGGAATIGVIVCIPPDQAAPIKGKFWHLLPAAVLGVPLFFAVQMLHSQPALLGLLLVPATFLAFLAGAWGKRGLPIVVSVMFAMVFSMAVPTSAGLEVALDSTLYFALGAGLYLVYATLANALLNGRYRTQMLADTLMALAQLMRTQAEQFVLNASADRRAQAPLIGVLLRQQAALTDLLQASRDLLLESPNSGPRQRLAASLMLVLEMRDHLMACSLDLEALNAAPGNFQAMQGLNDILCVLAQDIEVLADAYLLGQVPPAVANRRPQLAALSWDAANVGPAAAGRMLVRGLANRVGNLSDESVRMMELARGEADPDVALIRSSWQMFVSTTTWSWRPFVSIWRWDAPPLRHAVRAAMAIGFAYGVSLVLPWGTHDYWILLTIVVVLRGSLAQTLERRNNRVAGTLIGCLLAGLILAAHAPVLVMLLLLTFAQAIAHALAVRRYLVTAIAATVLGLVQAHMVNAGASPVFDVLERVADTLLGVSIAWAFSYVLPSWERHQIAALVARALTAQARYAQLSLTLGQVDQMEIAPELAWRLARRESYDSLSALVQATQRALAEPRAVQPPLAVLGRILARSYQLLGQLTSIKTMLTVRRARLQLERIAPALSQTALAIDATLSRSAGLLQPVLPPIPLLAVDDGDAAKYLPGLAEELSDPFESDLTPWMLRRLHLLTDISCQLSAEVGAFTGESQAL
jgi:uncharacterized membrane protein YccC